ncbi:dynein light chain Tctex-type 4 [Daubentonia madagascariensis]|uniref:Dynein light chain Tctex-type 4 n=1 Tax=Daubentonia madagascariensis TaxID=31869 RepID=A0ABD2E0V1_DAUMA
MAGRPLPPGRQEEETAKDPGLKLPPMRPRGRLPSIDEARPAGLGLASRCGSVLGLGASFSRRNSLAGPGAGPGGRRPSLGPVPPLASRFSFSGLPLAPARRVAPSYCTEPAPAERWGGCARTACPGGGASRRAARHVLLGRRGRAVGSRALRAGARAAPRAQPATVQAGVQRGAGAARGPGRARGQPRALGLHDRRAGLGCLHQRLAFAVATVHGLYFE